MIDMGPREPTPTDATAPADEAGGGVAPVLQRGESAESTSVAMQDTLLTPRFYTTDFDEMDRHGRHAGAARLGRSDRPHEGGRQPQALQERPRTGTRSTGTAWTRR